MAELVKLIGLDFGTTTSSAVVALASLTKTATGRMELVSPEEIFRSEMVFTPMLSNERIDLDQVKLLVDSWLEAGKVQAGKLFGGGALLTGLTAQKENAAALVRLIRGRFDDALVATADDPCLESWLSFMGSAVGLSRQHPEKAILNFDIGGGTTNLALGRNQQVLRTGSLFLGARHVQLDPGTYRIAKLSTYARNVFAHLHIDKGPGEHLLETEVAAFLNFYLSILDAVGGSITDFLTLPIVKCLIQVPFQMPTDVRDAVITFTGGVGELVYRHLQGEPWPTTTKFGDLGIDLAQRIVQSPIWMTSLRHFRPKSAGRATVYGLLQHSTEISGSTLFLGAPGILPLADLPILGRLSSEDTDARIQEVLSWVSRSSRGGCVQIRIGGQQASLVRNFGERVSRILTEIAFPATLPLVLLVQENVGKVLGQYVTRWGSLRLQLLVIDEVNLRDAQYVQIGASQHQIVPLSFYGLTPESGM